MENALIIYPQRGCGTILARSVVVNFRTKIVKLEYFDCFIVLVGTRDDVTSQLARTVDKICGTDTYYKS